MSSILNEKEETNKFPWKIFFFFFLLNFTFVLHCFREYESPVLDSFKFVRRRKHLSYERRQKFNFQ